MGSIYLIRHGQASFGAQDYDVLSPTGRQQAQALGEHLARLDLTFDRCISGSLLRQRDTAQIALSHMQAAAGETPALETDSAFDEFDAIGVIRQLLPAMLTDEPHALEVMRDAANQPAEFQRLFVSIIGRWLSGDYDAPGLQSWKAFVEQAQSGLNRILDNATPGQNIAVFTSGGTITALLHLITRIPVAEAFELNWQIVNTSLSHLKYRDGEVTLASFNGYTHLQLLNMPALITYR